MKDTLKESPRNPGLDVTGPVPVKPLRETIPLEELQEMQKKEQGPVAGSGQPTLLLPLMMNPAGGAANTGSAGSPRGRRCNHRDRHRAGTGTGAIDPCIR